MASLNSTVSLSRLLFREEFVDPVAYLMNSFYTPLIISSSYMFFVRKIGPGMMKNREPFNINKIIATYNIIQVVFNLYLCKKSFEYLYHHKDSFFCILPEKPGSEMYEPMRFLTKLFFINKSADLLDTVFFVLKKKESHLTFLHLYHHMLTFLGSWFIGNYIPGGGIAIFGFLNAFVHSIMYGYYLMCLFPFNRTVMAVLKKSVTQLQLLQFAVVGLYGLRLMTNSGCVIPSMIRYLGYFGLSQIVMMIILFTNFYRQAYLKKMKHLAENDGQTKKVRTD